VLTVLINARVRDEDRAASTLAAWVLRQSPHVGQLQLAHALDQHAPAREYLQEPGDDGPQQRVKPFVGGRRRFEECGRVIRVAPVHAVQQQAVQVDERAKALRKEAGVTTPLNLVLTLPPPGYAGKGGEVVAAMLASEAMPMSTDPALAALAAEGPRVPRQLRGFKVKLLAPGAALTLWRVKRDDGIETLRSSVWQQQPDGRWLMVFHQGTLAAQDDEATS
jgi:hypothetical protein